jgi:hypothetical protein
MIQNQGMVIAPLTHYSCYAHKLLVTPAFVAAVSIMSWPMAVTMQSAFFRGRSFGADAANANINPRLYGPDVLGERLVIPPNIPDWIMMDCEKSKESQPVLARIRDSVCESR